MSKPNSDLFYLSYYKELHPEVETREDYIKLVNGNHDLIIEDAVKIIDKHLENAVKKDFEETQYMIEQFNSLSDKTLRNEYKEDYEITIKRVNEQRKEVEAKSFNLAYTYALPKLRISFDALIEYKFNITELAIILENKLSAWYDMPDNWRSPFTDKKNKDKSPIEIKNEVVVADLPAKLILQEVNSLHYPLDKVNSSIWNELETTTTNGQINFCTFNVAKHNSGKDANIFYSLSIEDSDNLKITKKLTPFDERVMISVGALYNAGNEIMSITQIYKNMGNTSRPNHKQREKIYASLRKMATAWLTLQNIAVPEEEEGYIQEENQQITEEEPITVPEEEGCIQEEKPPTPEKEAYPKVQSVNISGNLLPMEIVDAVANGKIVESAIKLDKEPPLISFARQRNQITTIKPELLQSPLDKTNLNLTIESYLIRRIAQMKRQNKKDKSRLITKILYTSVYEKCKANERMQKKRAREKVKIILDHFIKCNYIKNYKEQEDGIDIMLESGIRDI